MAKTSNIRTLIRTDTEENWSSVNPKLLQGQIAYSSDVNKFKVGDGIRQWSQLQYTNNITRVSQLQNDKSYVPIQVGSTKDWQAMKGVISEKDSVYIVTDYYTDPDGTNHPGIKIGDGKAYIIDLPVTMGYTKDMLDHINNKTIHITQEEREDWNDKISCEIQQENLIFTTQ